MSNIEKLISAIESAKENGFRYFGIRTGKLKKSGQYCACSNDCDEDGDFTSKYLNGTCATVIGNIDFLDESDLESAISYNKEMYGWEDSVDKMQYIVAGLDAEQGRDDNEIIINNTKGLSGGRKGAKVIAII